MAHIELRLEQLRPHTAQTIIAGARRRRHHHTSGDRTDSFPTRRILYGRGLISLLLQFLTRLLVLRMAMGTRTIKGLYTKMSLVVIKVAITRRIIIE